MPTPAHRRALPDHVEIPSLPPAMDGWFDLVQRADGQLTIWRGQEINLAYVVDGLTAARALDGFRYVRDGIPWTDVASDDPGQWRRTWIVIAFDNGGAPFIVDLAHGGLPVMFDALSDPWAPEPAHATLAEFIDAIEVVAPPVDVAELTPPDPYPVVSLTVLDWGPARGRLFAELTRRHSHLYQPRMFRRMVETPVVLTRRLAEPNAQGIMSIIEQHGGRAEVGAPIAKQPPQPDAPAP